MSQITESLQRRERTAQFMWTGFILVFFLVQAVLWAVAITFTANDPSHAVVSGYDEKALNWDQEKARLLKSEQLGWQSRLMIDSAADIRGNRAVTLELVDQNSQPVSGATIDLAGFHRARAGEKQKIQLTEINDGVYSGQIRIQKPGHWQFDGSATLGDDTFLVAERVTINRAVN